jgi:hypothetical protein
VPTAVALAGAPQFVDVGDQSSRVECRRDIAMPRATLILNGVAIIGSNGWRKFDREVEPVLGRDVSTDRYCTIPTATQTVSVSAAGPILSSSARRFAPALGRAGRPT